MVEVSKGSKKQTQKQAAETPRTSEEPQPKKEPRPQSGAQIDRVIKAAHTLSNLSPEGEAYRDELIRQAQEFGLQELKSTSNDYLLIYNKKESHVEGIVFIFSETSSENEYVPPVQMTEEAYALFSQHVGRFYLLDTIVVDPVDYDRVRLMASFVANQLSDTMQEAREITVQSFGGRPLVVDCELSNVLSYINKFSPHGVSPRCDFGALVQLDKGRDVTQPMNTGAQRESILAIAGYTEFIQAETGMLSREQIQQGEHTKYVPIVTISEIVSHIPSPNLMGIALPVAAQAFIMHSQWLAPYGYGKNTLNLGNLVEDGKSGKMWSCESQQQRDQLLAQYMLNPFLAIDIQDGRADLPGIQYFRDHPGEVVKLMQDFTQGRSVVPPQQGIPKWEKFGGYATIKGQKADIRYTDYLHLAKDIKDAKSIKHFLHKQPRPDTHLQNVRNVFPDAKVLYGGHQMVLPADFVNSIIAAISQSSAMQTQFLQGLTQLDPGIKTLMGSTANQFDMSTMMPGPGYGSGGYQYQSPHTDIFIR